MYLLPKPMYSSCVQHPGMLGRQDSSASMAGYGPDGPGGVGTGLSPRGRPASASRLGALGRGGGGGGAGAGDDGAGPSTSGRGAGGGGGYGGGSLLGLMAMKDPPVLLREALPPPPCAFPAISARISGIQVRACTGGKGAVAMRVRIVSAGCSLHTPPMATCA